MYSHHGYLPYGTCVFSCARPIPIDAPRLKPFAVNSEGVPIRPSKRLDDETNQKVRLLLSLFVLH